MFCILLLDSRARDQLTLHLKAQRINAVFHYVPLRFSPAGRRLGGQISQCPVAEEMAGRLVRLPFFAGLTATDQARVIAAIRTFAP